MRKFLLSTVALMMSVAMMAIGAGNGTNKANAIDFDWADGHKPALSAGSWYRVSLSPLKAQANDPTLALYLTNLTDEAAAVSVTVEASLLGQSSSSKFNYNIAGKDYQLWSKKSFNAGGRELSLKQMMDLGLSEIYLQLTANKEIALSAKVYETEDIVDDACSKAKDFDWAGVSVPAGEQWYRLNLAEVKSQNKQLKFVVANNGVSAANVAFDMSLDCPASAVIEKDWVIAAGAEQKDELGRVFLDVMNEDYVFVKLTTNQPLTLSVEEEVVVVDPDLFADFDCASAPELVFDEEMNLTAGKHVYKVRRAELIAERDFDTEFHVTNNTDAAANLAVEVAFACPVKSVVTQNLVINAHESIMKLVKGDMLKAVNSEWVYIRFVADQDLTATVGMRNVSPCVNAVPFDWNVGAALNAGESQWYEVNIASLKQDKKHLTLAFTNHSDNIALVNVEVALDCNGTILPITLPIPAGLSVGQTIDYNLLKHVPLDRIYVGVSTDSHIEMAASVKDAIAADPSPCLNAINPVHGVEYTHEANTTNWYKISLDLLESTTDYSSIYLANKGSQRAHVTLGVVTDCQYTPSSRITLPMPTKFDLGILGPNVLGKLLKELARIERIYNKVDSKDIYLEIHSDQPIGFGLDVVNSTTNPCLRDDLITFDWNQGAKVEKGDGMKWYDMDLDAVKAAGKHVKLTFTNHTDSLVWAATVVSAECPAKLTMPLLVPVPAGMSVDKVINYQLFAVADIHNIYIGVMTDGALELKAESTDATIIPPADCLVAKTIVSGEEFVQQPGTQWYQFPMSLIDEMGDAASISFKNMTSKHATLTTGVTTSCEYAAATVAKVKVPRDIEFTLNMPKSLISKVRGLIDPAIANFYLQLTTDQAIAFTLNTQATGVRACASAVEFDWTAWEIDGLQLEANKEQWYKVNIAHPLEKLKNGEDITLALSNPNLMPVEVDLAISPTCPVVLSLEKSVTVPAKTAVSKTISYDEVMKLLAQYDKYDLADRDFGKLMEQINVYVLYNKLTQLLTDRGYDKYLPLDKIDPVVNKYGEAASLANLKELVENYDKYLTVAELKSRLEPYKEKVSIETLLGLIDKYGDYIPYVDAQQLIDNADVLIPYIGTANVIVDKCKQYISKDDLKKLVERIKGYVPFEEMKKLVARLEKYLPEENVFYLYVKASGDLEINPGAPIEPDCTDEAIETTVEACDVYEWHGVEYTASGDYTYTENVANCEDAEWLDWKQPIKLSEFTAPWYKLDVSEIIANESDFSLTLVNDLGESVQMPLELHYYCSEDGDGFIASDSREIAEGTYTREIPYALFDEFIGPEYETIYLHNVKADCDRVEVLHLTIVKSETTTLPIEYATICEGETYDWRGNTYSVSDTIVVEEALECGKAIHTLKLDVINNDTVMPKEYMTICEGETYPWHGTDYTVSGTYTDVVALTCGTATYTLVLDVINGDTTITTDATICEGETYTWHGTDYTVAGTYTDVVTLTCGTATYTLVLDVINGDTTITTDATICEGESYEWRGTTYTVAGTYTDAVALTCGTATYTLVLDVINGDTTITTEATICEGESYEWRGTDYTVAGTYTDAVTLTCGTATYTLVLTVKDCSVVPPTPQDSCENAEVVDWRGPINIPETTGKWYKVDVAEALASGKDIEMTVNNGPVANDVVMKMSTECFDPASALATTTVKAIVPADWTDQIYVWVWPTGGTGTEYPATKEGDFWTYTHNGDDVNIIFKNGQGWQGLYYQTEDMTFSEDACIKLTADVYGGKATYSVVNCSGGKITVKAQVPADWTDQIYVWVWPTGGAGTEYPATKEGDFWTYTHTGDYVNIIFKNGQGWQGAKFQTEDMTFSEDACIELIPNGEYNKAIYQVVDCGNSNTSVGSKYTETRTSYYANEVRKTIITQDRLAELNINDYVYVYVETTGSMTITATTIEDTPCENDTVEYWETADCSYTWDVNGVTYDASGDYEYVTDKGDGCTLTEILHLTVNPCPPTPCEDVYVNVYAEFCGSYPWNGVIYTEGGKYVKTFHLTTGCDSIVTLYLTEKCEPIVECDTVYTEFDAQFCDKPYNWNGQLYDVEGDHVQILKKTDGCDSIVTMHLTKVCEPIPSCEDVYTEFTTTFCGTFVWNKQEYTEAGDYTQVLSKTDGCDSIVTLHLIEECEPEIPGNPCLDAIPFDWTTGAYLAADSCAWYEMDITSLVDNKQHLTLTFTNHSDTTALVLAVFALDCEGKMAPMLLPIPGGLSIDQTIDYQLLKRSPLKRIYVGVCTDSDIELASSVESAIATDQTPCLNATEVQYNETYVHEPGTSWYKVSVDLLKNNSDALGFYFANKGNKHAHVTVGMVADCQYTTGTTITLPIPTGLDFNVLAPNLLKVLMQEVESFEEKLNDWDVQEIYVKLTSDQTIEFALKEKDGNYDCESAIDFDWADWEANGIQLQADQDVWYRMNMEYPIEKLLREEEMVIAITNFDSVAIDVEMTVSPTCPIVVSVDKSFSVPARTAVKKTLSYADAMQWLARHDEYLPYEQIKLFVDKYGDHLSYAELKDMLKNFKKYISVEQLKQELAKHKDYIDYENVEAALNKYGKFIPYVDAEALLKKFEDEGVIAAGYAVIVLKQCEPYITAENFWQLVEKCKPYIPFEELKQLLEIVEKHLEDYTCYLHVKTTGDLYVGPKPLPIPCDDVLVEDTVEACGQYEWKGVLYTESGDYSYTQPLADPTEAEFLDWKQPIKLSEFTKPWYKVDVTEVFATQTDFTLLIENDLNEAQEVNLALHDAMAEFLLSGTWNVATGVHPKTVKFEKFEQIVDPEHKVLYLHNMNYDCERTEVLHLTIVDCNETITAAVCDGSVYVDPITNVEHLISSLVPSTLTWTETVLSANKEKTVYTYVITPVVAPAGLTAEVLATIPGATPVLTPGLMPNITGTAEAIKAYYESIDTDSVSDVVSVSWETAAVACGATSHTMTLVVEDDCDNVVKAEITLEVATVEPVEETVTACDSYEWNGTTYTTSGDYTYTTTNANGCDSVVILHLTINKSETVEETVTACDSYEWHGQTYTASGDYTFTTVAANGCDRIEILHLTINQSETVEETVTACDSYEWNGTTYTTSGDYTFTTVAANGCDSVVILHLTINKSETVEETVTACDSYEWHGQTYTASGDYTFTTVAANGCDRIEILHLTINQSETVEETVTACDSYEWNGTTYTTSGDYTYTTTNANGCDSVVILHLTINQSETVEETITACDSYVWNGQTYTESGTYTYTTVAANGCDRIETLYLTINKSVVGEPLVVEICPGDSYSWEGEDYDQAGTYTITLTNAMGCDSIATLVLSIPDPENSADHAEIAAVSKYGGRLLVLDLNTITAKLGFTPASDNVRWYKIVGELDAAIDAWNQVGDDKYTGINGYYYENSGEKVDGQYYALFEQILETLPCNGIYRSVVLSAANAAKLPMLAPNVVGAEEDVRVLNLNSSTENAIRVYNMTGDLMATFKASYVDEFAFKAASFSGYYMVEIENAYEKVTLRYIVK